MDTLKGAIGGALITGAIVAGGSALLEEEAIAPVEEVQPVKQPLVLTQEDLVISEDTTAKEVYVPESKVKYQKWSQQSLDERQVRAYSRLEQLRDIKVIRDAQFVLEPENFELKSEIYNLEREIALQEKALEEYAIIEDKLK